MNAYMNLRLINFFKIFEFHFIAEELKFKVNGTKQNNSIS
jgi:hypothetical protein